MKELNEFGCRQWTYSIKNMHIKHLIVTYAGIGLRGNIDREAYACMQAVTPIPEKVARNPPFDVTCNNCIRFLKMIERSE